MPFAAPSTLARLVKQRDAVSTYFQLGVEVGVHWANSDASLHDLRRLDALRGDSKAEDGSWLPDQPNVAGRLAEIIRPDDRSAVADLWREVGMAGRSAMSGRGANFGQPCLARARGFCVGVMKVEPAAAPKGKPKA